MAGCSSCIQSTTSSLTSKRSTLWEVERLSLPPEDRRHPSSNQARPSMRKKHSPSSRTTDPTHTLWTSKYVFSPYSYSSLTLYVAQHHIDSPISTGASFVRLLFVRRLHGYLGPAYPIRRTLLPPTQHRHIRYHEASEFDLDQDQQFTVAPAQRVSDRQRHAQPHGRWEFTKYKWIIIIKRRVRDCEHERRLDGYDGSWGNGVYPPVDA